MENINNVKEGRKSSHSSKEKSFQGNQQDSKESNPSSSRKFSPQNKFRKNNWDSKSPKDTLMEFDKFLEQKLGSETLQKLANDAKKKINSLVTCEVRALELGVATTHHGEMTSKNKHGSESTVPPKFLPNKSYLRNKKEIIENKKEEIIGKIKVEPVKEVPTRGFALAKYKKNINSNQNTNTPRTVEQITESETSHLRTPGGILLDEWQYKALQALLAGKHVIVDAPTSAGKTRVIEALLEYRMKEGGKLIYTSPVKSLSNDKYREFSEKYGRDAVGINTGDFKENLTGS